MDEMLTTAEAAELLRVSEFTIRRWCASGRLPAIKLGRDWRISRTRLDRKQLNTGMGPEEFSAGRTEEEE